MMKINMKILKFGNSERERVNGTRPTLDFPKYFIKTPNPTMVLFVFSKNYYNIIKGLK